MISRFLLLPLAAFGVRAAADFWKAESLEKESERVYAVEWGAEEGGRGKKREEGAREYMLQSD